ncbi:hypothetical protein C8R42DRAFT_725808 [Lentinula raphanica]|nr:hypothetical protein C8R42DRAFT_725808 [Lentinula raphanica]
MASSSKASSSKKKIEPPPARMKKSYLFPADAVIRDSPEASPSLTSVQFNQDVRPAGGTFTTEGVLFLPATPTESTRLQRSWRNFPNSFPSAFELPRYTSPEAVDLSTTLFLNTSKLVPTTFYSRPLVRLVDSFSSGPTTRAEGYLLYQAISSLQTAVAHIIHKHASNTRNRALLLELLASDRLTASLDHYRSFWHRGQDCPLFAALFIALFCDYCENLLSADEYREYVYDETDRSGGGMSKRSCRQVKASYPDASVTLTSLAIPIPLDPSTKEGQLLITVCHKGPANLHLIHPFSHVALLPDPSGFMRPHRCSLTPDNEDTDSDHISAQPAKPATRRHPPPAAYSDIELEDEDEDEGHDLPAFEDPEPDELIIPKIRESIARAAKSKGRVINRPVPSEVPPALHVPAKRERVATPDDDVFVPEGPLVKKKRSQKAAGKSRAVSPSTSLVPDTAPGTQAPLRIQEGPPDYFENDDTRDPGLALSLVNPNFTIKTGFASLLIPSTSSKRGARTSLLLRPPKFLIADELRNLGAFLTTAEVTFSLPTLSRYNYLTSQHLRTLNTRTLPAHTSAYSSTNCLTCLSRGLVCEGGSRANGSCNNCEGTHRSCPSCLSFHEHQDRFQAIHQAVQGYLAGYADTVDAFEKSLDRYTHLHASFEPLFADARQDLAKKMQRLRSQGFDANVVLSRWAEENPNVPVNFETLSWLSTLFGWTTSCNVAQFLSNPSEIEKLEVFLWQIDPEPTAESSSLPGPSPISPPDLPVGSVCQPELKSKRKPAAATPINFPLPRAFQTPASSSAPTLVADRMEVDDGGSRTPSGRALLEEYDDSDKDDNAEPEFVTESQAKPSSASKSRK